MEILSHKVMTLHNRLLETGNKDRSRWSSVIYAFQVKYKVFGGLIGEMITLISEPEK